MVHDALQRPKFSNSDRVIARTVVRPFQNVMYREEAGGIVLIVATLVALVWANPPGATPGERDIRVPKRIRSVLLQGPSSRFRPRARPVPRRTGRSHEQVLDDLLGDRLDFLVGPVLDRMGHEDGHIGKSERCRLSIRTTHKLTRRNEHARHSTTFKISDVVHTARRAAASISECLDDEVALGGDLVAQVNGCRLGEGRLGKALDSHSQLGQPFLDAVKEDMSPRLADVQQPDSEIVE